MATPLQLAQFDGRVGVLFGGDSPERPGSIASAEAACKALAALDALADLAGSERRRVAILGEMAELGDTAGAWHDTVATKVLATGVHWLIGVGGTHTPRVVKAVQAGGVHASEADPTVSFAQDIIAHLQPGDVVLIKGANALGLEATARDYWRH